MSIFKQIRSIFGKPGEIATPAPAPDKPLPSPISPVERRSRKRLGAHTGRRVLIIDDSPTILAALKKMLQSAGCRTQEALDAKAGLDLVSKEIPDLIFLDIVLPGMSGFTVLRMLRRDPLTQNIPIIMISGNEQATEQFYVKRIGADDFMKKPFSRFEVFARMESLVDLNKLPRIKPVSRNERKSSETAGERIAEKAVATRTRETRPGNETTEAPMSRAGASQPGQDTGGANEKEKLLARPLAPIAISPLEITALEARKRLTEMGLTYYSQEEFVAAIARGDKLALELFIAGGGVDINV